MLYSLWYNFITEYKRIVGTGGLLVLFVVSVFYLYLTRHRDSSEKEASDAVEADSSAYELPALILSPMAAIATSVSRAFRELFSDIEASESRAGITKSVMKIVIVCMAIFALVISGKRIFSRELVAKAENNMHISNELKEAMDYVINDAVSEGAEKAVFITNPKYSYYFEAYSSYLVPAYKEPASDDELSQYDAQDRDAYLELRDTFPNMGKVVKAASKDDCKYIVFKAESYWPKVPLTELGFKEAYNNGGFIVYKAEGGNE